MRCELIMRPSRDVLFALAEEFTEDASKQHDMSIIEKGKESGGGELNASSLVFMQQRGARHVKSSFFDSSVLHSFFSPPSDMTISFMNEYNTNASYLFGKRGGGEEKIDWE